jgi:hypothetical protein
LLQGATVASPDNQYLFGVVHGQHGHVGNHFMIAGIIPLRELDDTIQNQRLAKKLGLNELEVLVRGLLIHQDFLDAQ